MPITPGSVPWTLRLDDTYVVSSPNVTSWTDISGNGKNMTGVNTTVGGGTPTGKASVAFNGMTAKFTSAYAISNFFTSTQLTIFIVAKPTGFTNAGAYYVEGCLLRDNGGYVGVYAGQNSGDKVGTWVADTWPWPNAYVAASSGTWKVFAVRLKADGTLGVSDDGGASWVTDTAGDPIGSLSGSLELGAGSATWFTGELAGVYLLDSAMSDSDLGDIYAYLYDRFILSSGVTVTNANVDASPILSPPTVAAGSYINTLTSYLKHAGLKPGRVKRAT